MNLLVIGGTIFLGRHLVEAALARGHRVTLFHRGLHNPNLFPRAETILGDRDGNLDRLGDRTWDAAIDTCGYFPRVVQASAEALQGRVERYVFVSSVSVYGHEGGRDLREDAPVEILEEPYEEKIEGHTYGPLKAMCEQAVEEVLPGRSVSVRPGLIVGPHDLSDRFTYWPLRVARGGRVLAPKPRDRQIQVIDVRDLAEWIIRLVQDGARGTFNAVGPEEPLTMGELLEECQQATGRGAELVWVEEEFLVEQEVRPFLELPLWVPGGIFPGVAHLERALAAGLTFRPLARTIRDTLDWAATQPADRPLRAGLTLKREEELLRLSHGA